MKGLHGSNSMTMIWCCFFFCLQFDIDYVFFKEIWYWLCCKSS